MRILSYKCRNSGQFRHIFIAHKYEFPVSSFFPFSFKKKDEQQGCMHRYHLPPAVAPLAVALSLPSPPNAQCRLSLWLQYHQRSYGLHQHLCDGETVTQTGGKELFLDTKSCSVFITCTETKV